MPYSIEAFICVTKNPLCNIGAQRIFILDIKIGSSKQSFLESSGIEN